mmetsp:Transcript_115914/g.324205  ORF Transcript_115914/g.324205 Transcript_115914/m.324205 type:complete len:307 (+) Transcript_115914:539-1459(+)
MPIAGGKSLSCKHRHHLPPRINASPRLLALLEAYRVVPVQRHRVAEPSRGRLVETLPPMRPKLLRCHELDIVPGPLRQEGPHRLLDKDGVPWHVHDNALVQALCEVALLSLKEADGGRRVQVHAEPYAVAIPDVHCALHTRRHVVDGLQHADHGMIEAMRHGAHLIPRAHVCNRPPLGISADDAVVKRELVLPGRQQLAVALAPMQRRGVAVDAPAHVSVILPQEAPAEGLAPVHLREVAEPRQWPIFFLQRHEVPDLALELGVQDGRGNGGAPGAEPARLPIPRAHRGGGLAAVVADGDPLCPLG